MDPDQDLLDQLDRRENGGIEAITALIVGISLIAGLVGYFTLRLQLHSGREISLDVGMLIVIGAGALLAVAYRKIR
jgi:hypothetical protein